MSRRFSQNGYEAFATPAAGRFVRFEAAGQKWWAADSDVAVVFRRFIERFDKEVEEITQSTLDDWSYANRLIRGSSTVVSNHGSATAIDINALKHPRGVHNTFTNAKEKAMEKIRDAITDNSGRPVLRLGKDYTETVDDMHVEINANRARVKQAADKIREEEENMALSDADVNKIATASAKKLLETRVPLTEAGARHLGKKEGDKISILFLLLWGGPGIGRLANDVDDLLDDAVPAPKE